MPLAEAGILPVFAWACSPTGIVTTMNKRTTIAILIVLIFHFPKHRRIASGIRPSKNYSLYRAKCKA
jgi:hypothetical protein